MRGMIRKVNSVLYRCGRHYGQSHCIRNANLLKILLDRLNPLYAIRDIYRIQTLANDEKSAFEKILNMPMMR